MKSLLRYWGSHFKSRRQAANFVVQFEALIKRGWRCHLVLEYEPEDLQWLAGLRELGVGIFCIARPKGSFDLRSIRAIHKLCKETACHVVHCDNMHMSPLIGAALARVPVRIWHKRAMNSHYEQCHEPGWRERLALTSRLSAFLTTRVVAVSSAVACELTDLGISCDKVVVLNNPRPEMKATKLSKRETRRTLGIPEDAVIFVTVGRAEKVKGWDVLIEAFARVVRTDPRACLLLVGATEVKGQELFKADLDACIGKHGIADCVHFAGHVTDVRPMLLAGDVFVLPSRSEGCCNALLEALEVGLPCVATKVGNAAESLDGGRAGILVERNDPVALAAALGRTLHNDSERATMAAYARVPGHVADRRGHAQHLADLYESLYEQQSRLRFH